MKLRDWAEWAMMKDCQDFGVVSVEMVRRLLEMLIHLVQEWPMSEWRDLRVRRRVFKTKVNVV
jgi:hypothetical protein